MKKKSIPEISHYRFYKKDETIWYVDLPDYPGSSEDLMMVAGADELLDDLSEGKDEIWLSVSESEFPGSERLRLIAQTGDGGADYSFGEKKIWLCSVTEYVFGYYPRLLFFKPGL